MFLSAKAFYIMYFHIEFPLSFVSHLLWKFEIMIVILTCAIWSAEFHELSSSSVLKALLSQSSNEMSLFKMKQKSRAIKRIWNHCWYMHSSSRKEMPHSQLSTYNAPVLPFPTSCQLKGICRNYNKLFSRDYCYKILIIVNKWCHGSLVLVKVSGNKKHPVGVING